MSLRRVSIAFLLAAAHYLFANACIFEGFKGSSRIVSHAAFLLYLGLSLPVLLYRAAQSEPLSLDLLSWNVEMPLNSLIVGFGLVAVWWMFEKRGVSPRNCVLVLVSSLAASTLLAWWLNGDAM